MVIAAGEKECCLVSETLREFKAKDIAVERERPIQVGHLQMNLADANL